MYSMEIKKMTIEKICKKDNTLQRKLLCGEISEAEFNYRKQQVHDEYIIATGEEAIIKKLLKKHGSV